MESIKFPIVRKDGNVIINDRDFASLMEVLEQSGHKVHSTLTDGAPSSLPDYILVVAVFLCGILFGKIF